MKINCNVTTGLAFLILAVISPINAAFAASDSFTSARQAIVVDCATGTVLYEKNADQRMTPSSMSKEMTMYLVFDALKSGRIKLDQMFSISENAWHMGGSRMFVKPGSSVKVEDLIRGVAVDSGNDAAVALAEGIAGSQEAFVEQENIKAQKLGMTHSHFANASGWPDPDHYSTARDLVILARRMTQDFPEYYHFYSRKQFTYNNINQGNRNPLLYRNISADGIKTGHTEDGGYGLMGSGMESGRRIVFVANGMDSMQERADEGAKLLQWGLKSFENVKLFHAGEVVEQDRILLGKQQSVPLTVEKDILVTLPVATEKNLKVKISFNAPLKAPLQKGMALGTMFITLPQGQVMETPLVAAQSVEPLGLFAGAMAKFELLISGQG